MIAVHGPSITEKSHLVQVLSSGYVNFIQVYDVFNGLIFASEFDENEESYLSHESDSLPNS